MTTPTQRNPLHGPTPEREREIRDLLGLAGLAFEDELAIALRCSPRTVQRLDLDYAVVGNKRLYDLRIAAEKLRQITRIGASNAADLEEGALPPAVRHRRRLEREGADTA